MVRIVTWVPLLLLCISVVRVISFHLQAVFEIGRAMWDLGLLYALIYYWSKPYESSDLDANSRSFLILAEALPFLALFKWCHG